MIINFLFLIHTSNQQHLCSLLNSWTPLFEKVNMKHTAHTYGGSKFPCHFVSSLLSRVGSPLNRVAQGEYYISGCLRNLKLLNLAMLMVQIPFLSLCLAQQEGGQGWITLLHLNNICRKLETQVLVWSIFNW